MKKILFTGGSGFLGRNTIPSLQQQGYKITSIGLMETDDLKVDLSETIPPLDTHYDIVFHAAGKAHSLPKSISERQLFFDINLRGTQNLCNALEKSNLPNSFILISTVAVYGCETGENITEEHPLNGNSSYAVSKIQAEIFLQDWCKEHGIILTILRPSLIAGKNPPGNLGAMIHSIKNGRYYSIAGSKARKSIVRAEDIAHLIPLVEKKGGIYNICDTYHPSFAELEEVICRQLGKKKPKSIPYWIAKSIAIIGDLFGDSIPLSSAKLEKITQSLTFSNRKAVDQLDWHPLNVLNNFRI